MLGRLIKALARAMAVLGGLVLTLLIAMTCLSIAGRFVGGALHAAGLGGLAGALHVGPVEGDLEIVEATMAFVVFAFLPTAQLHDGHASVDVFTGLLGRGANRALSAAWAALFAAVLILVAWQLLAGTRDKLAYGETTSLLQFPVWWGYAAALAGGVVAAAVALYVAAVRVAELVTGRAILPATDAAP